MVIDGIIRQAHGVAFASTEVDGRMIRVVIDGGDDEQLVDAVFNGTEGCIVLPVTTSAAYSDALDIAVSMERR